MDGFLFLLRSLPDTEAILSEGTFRAVVFLSFSTPPCSTGSTLLLRGLPYMT